MKKLLAIILAALMIAACSVTAFAADTTTVTYEVQPTYTVSIPASVTLGDAAVTADVTASDVILESGKKIKVELTSASNTASGSTFNAKNGDSTVTYTITGDKAIAVGDTVATFTANGSKTLTFSAADKTAATVAGAHTETLTFTVSVETSKAAAEKPDIVQADCTFSPANGTSTLSNANITTSMEYSADNGTTWTDVTSDGSIASLAAGTVQIRVKETGDKLASEAVSITVPQVLQINELVGPYTGDKLTCEYYAGETWQALVDRYDLIKVYSGRAAFDRDGFIYDESGSAVRVTALVDNTKTYEVQ